MGDVEWAMPRNLEQGAYFLFGVVVAFYILIPLLEGIH